MVNVSSGHGIGALRGPGDRCEDEVWWGLLAPYGRAGRLQRRPFVALVLPILPPMAPSLGTPFFGIITIPISI